VRTFRLSKSRITAGLQCGKRLWLAVHRPELEAYTADVQRRFVAGHGVGEVARELYPGGVLIGEGASLSQALRETEQALAQPGDVTLYEATFRHKGVMIRADVLERRGGRYRMVEVKSATRLKEYHLQDIAIQVGDGGAGVHAGQLRRRHRHRLRVSRRRDYRGLLREIPVADQARPLMAHIPGWVRGLNEVLAGPLPARQTGNQCRRPFECPFVAFCEGQEGKTHCDPGEERDEDGACALPPDPALGTLDPAATPSGHTAVPACYLDFETAVRRPLWRARARTSRSSSSPVNGGDPADPQGVPRHERRGACARLEALLEAVGGGGPIFVYHDFEKWRLVEMAAMFPDIAPALDAVAGRLVDLLRLTRDHYDHPALNGSYSLKVVLPTVDADWTMPRRSRTASPPGAYPRPSTSTPGAPRCVLLAARYAASTRSPWCAWRTASPPRTWRRDAPHRDRRRRPPRADALRHPARAGHAEGALHRQDAVAGQRRGGPLLRGQDGRGLWTRLGEAGI
jgi:hypothetical protein